MFLLCSDVMTRRTTPQKQVDDRAFPVRLLVEVPACGLGRIGEALNEWLEKHLGRTEYAWHGGGSHAGRDALALYFRRPDDAAALCEAFPILTLADGTTAVWYTSPYLPSGRPPLEDTAICNLYNQTRTQDAMRQLFSGISLHDRVGNLEPGEIYPDRMAPIVRHAEDGAFELVRPVGGCHRRPRC